MNAKSMGMAGKNIHFNTSLLRPQRSKLYALSAKYAVTHDTRMAFDLENL